jgi:hypothetical protein
MNSLQNDLVRVLMDARLESAHQRQLAHLARRPRGADRRPRRRRRGWRTWVLHVLSRTEGVALALGSAARSRRPALRPPGTRPGIVSALPRMRRPSPAPRVPPTQELAELLDHVATTIAEEGTSAQKPVLELVSAAARLGGPGAAAALVDWDGSETARLRAYGVVHGLVLDLPTHEQIILLARIRGGADLPLAG